MSVILHWRVSFCYNSVMHFDILLALEKVTAEIEIYLYDLLLTKTFTQRKHLQIH